MADCNDGKPCECRYEPLDGVGGVSATWEPKVIFRGDAVEGGGNHVLNAVTGRWDEYTGVAPLPPIPMRISYKPVDPKSLLEQAHDIVHGERAADYGHPRDNFKRIVNLWNAYLQGRPDPNALITEQDHAILMLLVKIARLQNTPNHEDSLRDMAGYVGTIERLWSGK